MKRFILALGIAITAPALAAGQSDTAKDADDKVKDAVDSTKDNLGTDSGAEKAGRHVDRAVRTVKHKARHAKKAVKEEIHEATK
jgi:hypothetical protein